MSDESCVACHANANVESVIGDVIFIIKLEHLETKIINSSNMNFKKYYTYNKEYYFHYVNNKKYKNSFSNIEKANIINKSI